MKWIKQLNEYLKQFFISVRSIFLIVLTIILTWTIIEKPDYAFFWITKQQVEVSAS